VPVVVSVLAVQAIGTFLALAIVLLVGEAPAAPGALLWAAAGGMGGLVGVTSIYLALSRGTMGIVAPLTGVIAAAVPVVIGLLTGHAIHPVALVGILLALAAVAVVAMPAPGVAEGAVMPAGAALIAAGDPQVDTRGRLLEWALVLIAGIGFAAFFLGVDRAHGEGAGTWWTLLVARGAALVAVVVGLAGLVASDRRPALSGVAGATPVLMMSALGDMGGNLFYVLALGETTLAVAVVLSSLYPVATAILARVVLGERLTRTALLGVALAIGGVVLIGIGSTSG
jgi:drug/metabolite transporter (DMT)-like permease